MSYKYETQYNSPNYTAASQTQSVWGQPRVIKAIAIHWWGDPNTGPTYEGVIATLCNPNRGASAHYVATGTGRRVACLVSPSENSWATNSANPWTISIECDPRCRDEDYDVVAELISQIRDAYGDLPLVPHRQFVATACPGNYDLNRLDQLARSKDGSGDWGTVNNRQTNANDDQIRAAYQEILERPADQDGINHYRSYTVEFMRNDLYQSQERKNLIARKEQEAKDAQAAAEKAELDRIAKEKAEAEAKAKAEKDARDKAEADAKAAAEKAAQDARDQEEANKPQPSVDVQSFKDFLKELWEKLLALLENFKRTK